MEFVSKQKSFHKEKKAILVVSFGTSYNDTRDKTIGAIEKEIQLTYKEYDVKRAFTSQFIISKLKQRDGIQIDTVKEAMDKLIKEGYTTVICQPTHVMHGFEYDEMIAAIKPYEKKIKEIRYCKPLLSSDEDYIKTVSAIQAEFPVLKEAEGLILVGHGTEHFADAVYAALDYRFKSLGSHNIFVGTVEGFPHMEAVKKELQKTNYKKLYLMPFMIVAGDHANNDICGEAEGTWKRGLEAMGYEVEPVLKGLGEVKGIRHIFLNHIDSVING